MLLTGWSGKSHAGCKMNCTMTIFEIEMVSDWIYSAISTLETSDEIVGSISATLDEFSLSMTKSISVDNSTYNETQAVHLPDALAAIEYLAALLDQPAEWFTEMVGTIYGVVLSEPFSVQRYVVDRGLLRSLTPKALKVIEHAKRDEILVNVLELFDDSARQAIRSELENLVHRLKSQDV